MAITQSQKKRKRESETYLRRSSVDITIEDINKGEPLLQFKDGTILYEADIEDVPEDWDEDPKIEAWMKQQMEEHRKWCEKHLKGWTEEDIEEFLKYKFELSKRKPELPWPKIHQMAFNAFKAKIKKRKEH